MNRKGEVVDKETDAYGMKVTIQIHRPDMAIAFDEVGCNLCMEGDNSVGGKKYITDVDGQAYQTSATRDSHFTCLGLTRFDGHPLMCVILLSGKKRKLLVETGIDTDNIDVLSLHKELRYITNMTCISTIAMYHQVVIIILYFRAEAGILGKCWIS